MEETRNMAALILSRQTYREHDVLVRVYTSTAGKLSLIARGAKKLKSKLAGHIEPLTQADIMVVKGRGRDYLGSAVTHRVYGGIRSDLNKLYYAGQALSVVDRLIKEDLAEQKIFKLLLECLDILDRFGRKKSADSMALEKTGQGEELAREKGELWLSFFILRLLLILGHQPEIRSCLSCSRSLGPGRNYFDLLDGGLVCEACRPRLLATGRTGGLVALSGDCLKIMRLIFSADLEKVMRVKADKKLAAEIMGLLTKFLKYLD